VLKIDHNETECSKLKECWYVIAVAHEEGQDDNNGRRHHGTLYQITPTHFQNNHIILQENKPYSDSCGNHEFKYYKFTLVDSRDFVALRVQLTPIHGDPDLYMSRNQTFPSREEYDLSSNSIGNRVDYVLVNADDLLANGTAEGTYYISVFAYSYASYSLVIEVKRSTDQKFNVAHLYEGLPLRFSIHNEFDSFTGQFKVDMEEGQERDIVFHLTPLNGRFHVYVNYGRIAKVVDHIWSSDYHFVYISRNDKHYEPQGTYFVHVTPRWDFWDLFKDNWYSFVIAPSLTSGTNYLSTSYPQAVTIKCGSYFYASHYIDDPNADVTISMTDLQGGCSGDMFISSMNKEPSIN